MTVKTLLAEKKLRSARRALDEATEGMIRHPGSIGRELLKGHEH